MARLLLAHPLFLSKSNAEVEASSPYFPLGLLYLAGYVRETGHDVAIFDGTFCESEQAFSEMMSEFGPDMVGISALHPTRSDALMLAAMASDYGAAVVLGGPDPTLSPTDYLAANSVDVVVHHEGEQTIARLLDLLDVGQLSPEVLADEPGVAFLDDDGQPTVNQPRPPIENLDELPLPARDLIDMDRYLQVWEDDNGYSSLTIATSRGCPFGCVWCRDAVHGTDYRQRSPESVAAEVRELSADYDIARLRFVDDVDGIERQWFEDWEQALDRDGTTISFEPLSESARSDLPLLDAQDSL